ncbi:MAG TPA: DoxX family protein [Thermoanaerobaculia bacterium]|jgi:putative oxidoreductase
MSRFAGPAHALLRIVSGLLFFCHGAQKLLGWFGGLPPGVPLAGLTLAAGVIELVGGLLILFGLFTRPAAFICSGEMAVAFFKAHFPTAFWPLQNHGEPAVLYCFIFLFLSANGPGPWSLDAWIARQRTPKI